MSLDGTRLDRDAYRAHTVADADRIAAAARSDADRAVPTCPGWSVADLAGHVAGVYAHKVAAVRLGREPGDGDRPDAPPDGTDQAEWLIQQRDALLATVYAADPDAPAWTWWPPEQTCGFWQRRMAQESLMHRVDAEIALGTPGLIDPDLAADGCDEILGWLAYPWTGLPQPDATGQTVRVSCGQHAWRAQMHPEEVHVAGAGGADASATDASITGPADQLLLWLWGRPVPLDAVTVTGDPTPVRLLRERLAMATS